MQKTRPSPASMIVRHIIQIGQFELENEGADLDVIKRDPKTELLYSEESCDSLLNQIHRTGKKDMVPGVPMSEIKYRSDMSDIDLVEAWIGAYQLKCRNVQLQPPKLSYEFSKWASERNLTLEKLKPALPRQNGFF